jgi:hypothetical protein
MKNDFLLIIHLHEKVDDGKGGENNEIGTYVWSQKQTRDGEVVNGEDRSKDVKRVNSFFVIPSLRRWQYR